MSIAVVDADTTAPAKPLPTGVSNLLSFWWLTIVFTALAALLFWPELPGPFTNKDGVSGFGSGMLWAVLFGLVGVGGLGAYWAATAKRTGLTVVKVGTIVTIAVVLGLVVLAMLKTREGGIGGLFEPVPMYGGILIAMVILLPLVFATMALLTLSTAEDLDEYYAAAATSGTGTTGQYLVPTALGGMAAGSGERAAAEALGYGEAEPRGAGTATLEPPHGADFDAAFDEAVEEAVPGSSAEIEASPIAETLELPAAPEAGNEVVVDFVEVNDDEAATEAEGQEVFDFVEAEEPPTEAETAAADFVVAEEVTGAEAEEGEVFDFELAPDEDQPPEHRPGQHSHE